MPGPYGVAGQGGAEKILFSVQDMPGTTDPLQYFRDAMLISGISSVCLGCLLVLLTRGRRYWRKLLDWEEGFWRRRGLTARWTAPLRKFEESRAVVMVVTALLSLHLLLLISAAVAHVHFGAKLRQKPPVRPPQSTRVPAKK